MYVSVPAVWGQRRGQDERKWPSAACASHPCPQSQLHPMHSFIEQTEQKKKKKKGCRSGDITHNAQRKPLFLSCPLNANTYIKAQTPTRAHAHMKTSQIWDSPLGITPMTHTGKGFPWGPISVHWEEGEMGCWDGIYCTTLLVSSSSHH